MSSPLTGVNAEIEAAQKAYDQETFRDHRPYATSILEELRPKLLEAARSGTSLVFVMSWVYEPELLQGHEIQSEGFDAAGNVPFSLYMKGAEILVCQACLDEGLHVLIRPAERKDHEDTSYLHMYVKLFVV